MVSIDNVYKTVLNILNKENRGYITPKEFNTLANQAQSEIFEGYFSSRNYAITNDSDHSDIRKNIEEKIDLFKNEETIDSSGFLNAAGDTTFNYYAYPSNFYRLISVVDDEYKNLIEECKSTTAKIITSSILMSPSEYCPIYVLHEGGIKVLPVEITKIIIEYIRKPAEPNWVGGTDGSGQIRANTADLNYQNFELHASEFPELVIRILTYAGVSIRAADITQAAATKEQQIIQSER